MANNLRSPNAGGGAGLEFIVGNHSFTSTEQFQTGAQIRQLAGLSPDDQLYLGVTPPWEDEPIGDDTRVDLARPEIEHFYVKKKLSFRINGVGLETDRQYVSGRWVRERGKIPHDQELYLAVQRPWDDELISEETWVDLARPGVEQFYSREARVKVTLIVNGREKQWEEKKISYEQVVHLAYGSVVESDTRIYTVTYKNGPHENPQGTMVKGDSVFVKNKMIFNVTATDKS